MVISKEIRPKVKNQLNILKDLDKIIYSPEFKKATYEKQREIIKLKQSELKKLSFLYNLEEAVYNETPKKMA